MARTAISKEIARELGRIGAGAPALFGRASIDKLYEVFILSKVCKALRSLGANLHVVDSSGIRSGTLTLRLSPGLIYDPAGRSGWVEADFGHVRFELHSGVRTSGKSRVLHELDVGLFEKEAADTCRTRHRSPNGSQAALLLECKYYGQSLPLRLGREYCGLSAEFPLRVKALCSNVSSSQITRLVSSHRGTVCFDVAPHNAAAVNHFVGWLVTELRNVISSYP